MTSGRTPEEYRDFFAGVFAELDARPRRTGVRFAAEELTIDLVDGEPVFIMPVDGIVRRARASFRRRWLAEHPVPLRLTGRREHVFKLLPASGNRVKVRT